MGPPFGNVNNDWWTPAIILFTIAITILPTMVESARLPLFLEKPIVRRKQS